VYAVLLKSADSAGKEILYCKKIIIFRVCVCTFGHNLIYVLKADAVIPS